MLKPIKLQEEDHNIFFVSDLHHSHNRIWIYEKRKYKDIQEHDNDIVHQWNSYCSNSSFVFHLGDIQFNDPDGEKLLVLLRRLNFKRLYLLWGNHTSGQKALYAKELKKQFANTFPPDDFGQVGSNEVHYEVYPLISNLDGNIHKQVIFLPQYVEVSVGGVQLVLSHYPILSWNGQSHGSFGLFGHSHSNCPITNKDTGKGKCIDLGWETFGRPISLKEVKDFMKNRDIVSYDHHGDSTT